ncbi:MAG: hypothetical protein U1E83_00500 [Methylotetracoccus sp.]
MENGKPIRSVSAEPRPGGVTIIRRWRNPFAYALASVTLLLIGICVAIFRQTLTVSLWHPVQLVPVFFSVLAALMSYIVAARLFNRTTIDAAPTSIVVRHGPLPWRKSCSIDPAGIDCLVVKAAHVTYDAMRATFYHVHARNTAAGADLRVLDADMSRSEAEFIACSLASAVNKPWLIADEPA